MPNASYLKDHFYNEGRILEEHAIWIVRAATEVLRREPNMVSVSSPMTGELSFFSLEPISVSVVVQGFELTFGWVI